jgi:hypothetical protein
MQTNETLSEPQTTTVYVIHWTSGGTSRPAPSLEYACRIAKAVMGYEPVIGHPGDISEGGHRSLIWPSEEAAYNDDGSRAVGEIRKELVWE